MLQFLFIIALFFTAPMAKAEGIVVTLPPLAGMISMLDPQAKVSCLLPSNADPHHFQLSPRQLETLQRADLLIRSSKDDGAWSISSNPNATLDLWPQQDHAWLDPLLIKQVLPTLAKVLQQRYPARKDNINRHLQQSLLLLDKEEKAWHMAMKSLKDKGVILQHPSWQRILKRYHVKIHATLESHQHGREHGPHILEHGLNILRQQPQAILLGDKSHSNRTLQWLANHHDRPTSMVLLNAMSQCGQSWFDFMQQNRKALQP